MHYASNSLAVTFLFIYREISIRNRYSTVSLGHLQELYLLESASLKHPVLALLRRIKCQIMPSITSPTLSTVFVTVFMQVIIVI